MFGPIHNGRGERLDYAASPGASDTLVVIGHGVTANKDRSWAVALADALGEASIGTLRMSFSGNGDSEGRFEESTISKEVEDLGAVLDVVAADRRIVYVGHSMGAAVGVLRAASDARIEGLVSLAGMVHTKAFAARKFGDVVPDQGLMWDKPECPLSSLFLADMEAIDSVVALGAKILVPWLLVHGTGDEVVPRQDSLDIRAAASGRPEWIELPGVDHVFSGAGESAMTAAVVPWVTRFDRS